MTSDKPLALDGRSLTVEAVVEVARQGRRVALADSARPAIAASQAYVESLLTPDAPPVYGINTGFGVFADRPVSPSDAALLSRNLILSHAVGTGDPFPEEVIRAAMLIRANTLAIGVSGVRPQLIETLIQMLNAGVHPVVPQQGSLGSSGDLAPLSHLALVFTTNPEDREEDSGHAFFRGERMSGKAAMQAAGIPRLELGAKEGLAVTNGASFSAAVAALAVQDAENLVRHAEIATALALESLLGVSSAFDERLHAARLQDGQWVVAGNMRRLIEGSTLIDRGGRVQDPYSLRCSPQVLGPVRDTMGLVHRWVENEINAATDNPLIFPDPPGVETGVEVGVEALAGVASSAKASTPGKMGMQALSGGNFHGEVLALAMDFLGIALAEVGALAERQIARLVSEKDSFGLPPMLVSSPEAAGLNSGLMMPHYTAASLALENQTLAHPDSVHSLTTSAGQEDHNANALTAARHARQIVENVAHILAVEFFAAAQALDLRAAAMPEAQPGRAARAALRRLRQEIPFVKADRLFGPEIERVKVLIREGEFVRAIASEAGIELE